MMTCRSTALTGQCLADASDMGVTDVLFEIMLICGGALCWHRIYSMSDAVREYLFESISKESSQPEPEPTATTPSTKASSTQMNNAASLEDVMRRRTISIRNLDLGVSEKDLFHFIAQVGFPADWHICSSSHRNCRKYNYGFVQMKSADDMHRVFAELNGKQLGGLAVNIAPANKSMMLARASRQYNYGTYSARVW
eukprot:GEMP01088595.1.p1 GENE.GEMP01088595.1~~GEMP01088595.1.p1  ORF type:complete len:196 (+),score=25.78 GEMP01088595.1:277-864(+)